MRAHDEAWVCEMVVGQLGHHQPVASGRTLHVLTHKRLHQPSACPHFSCHHRAYRKAMARVDVMTLSGSDSARTAVDASACLSGFRSRSDSFAAKGHYHRGSADTQWMAP